MPPRVTKGFDTHATYKVEATLLDAWRTENGLTMVGLARMLRVSETTCRRWCYGVVMPSLVAGFVIERVTAGSVPASSWLGTLLGKREAATFSKEVAS